MILKTSRKRSGRSFFSTVVETRIGRMTCSRRARRRRGGSCGREPGAYKLDHLRDGEVVREQHRLGAAVAARRKQFERAALLDICAALDHEAILMTTCGTAS